MTVELRQLEYFVAVAEECSFTRAAGRLHVVQSTLSVSIRTLERELGGRLFERTTHEVRLNDAGRTLLTEARAVLVAVEAARDAVAEVHGGVRGTVHVGIMRSLMSVDLAAVFTRYHKQHPQVKIVPHTAPGGSSELIARVLDGALDLAFAAMPGPYPAGLDVKLLASEPLMLACSDDHPLAGRSEVPLSELAGVAFIEFPPGWGNRASVDRLFETSGLRREIVVEVADVPTAVQLVRAGFGCAFLSESLTVGARPVTLRPVLPAPTLDVSLITSIDGHLSAAARAFVDLVRESGV